MKKKQLKKLFYMIKPIWEVSPAYVIINVLYTFENIPRRLLDVIIVKLIVDAAATGEVFINIIFKGILLLAAELFLVILKHCFTQMYKNPKEIEICARIKTNLFDKIKTIDIENYDNKEFYDKYTYAFCSADVTAFKVFNTMLKLSGSVIAALTLSSYMASLSPILIFLAVAGSAVSLMSNFLINKYKVRHQTECVVYDRKIGYISGIYAARQNAADIKMGLIPALLDDFFNKACKSKVNLEKKYGKKYAFFNIIFESPLTLTDMIMWIYIAYGILNGFLKVGDFMSLSNAAWSLSQQLRNIFNTFPAFHELNMIIENILVFDAYCSKLVSSNSVHIKADGMLKICIRDVSFTYPSQDNSGAKTLKNINFDMKSGEKIALVGQNGAGKTTIVKLLLRLYDPSEGTIMLNGHNYNEYNLYELRSMFSVVFQDFQYYSFSIAENILLRKPRDEHDRDIVDFALRKVGLYKKIHETPLGIDTQLTKNFDNEGILLSGGEFQKLVIARALAINAPIVIMDEPSSALDPVSEREISDLLSTVFQNKLIFIISHRLSMTKKCDKIMVIDDGEIVEQGHHEELIARGGKYAQLWQMQSEYYKE